MRPPKTMGLAVGVGAPTFLSHLHLPTLGDLILPHYRIRRFCWLALGSPFPAPTFGEPGNGRKALGRNFSKLKRLLFPV